MKKTQFLLFLIIFFIFWSCSNDRKITDQTVMDHSIRSELFSSIEEELIDTTIFKACSVIPLETTDESLFQDIDRICISNDRIYIYDYRLHKVIIFDEKGKYINQIRNIGQGPKEYDSTIDFCIDEMNSELILLCDRPYKMMRFSKDGEFIHEKTLSGFNKSITMDSGYFFCQTVESKDYEIACFDKEFNHICTGLSKLKNVDNSCYSGGKFLVKSKNICYTRRFDPSVYYLFKDSIVKKYEFDFGKYKAPMNLANEEDCEQFFKTIRENKYIFSITNVVESERYILFKTNICVCLYDKKTNSLKGYNMLYNPSLIWGSSVYYPNEGSSNSIIASFQPENLSYYSEETIKNNTVIKDLVDNSKEDDNPILVIYHFKE